MSARVRPSRATARRATRRRRCARCGFTAVYENASVVAADYWFGRHSCQRQEQLMVRAALGQQRRDLVDRTPQPCLHKVADHQHGTRACYVLDRCRCDPCSTANAVAESERERQKAYGRYHKYVSAEHVRAHLAELSMTLPPETNQRERIAASRSRNYAKARGWLPPLMLEDVDPLDDDAEYLDEVAIAKRMAGDKSVDLTADERFELARRWARTGRSRSDLERVTGLNPHRYLPKLPEAS